MQQRYEQFAVCRLQFVFFYPKLFRPIAQLAVCSVQFAFFYSKMLLPTANPQLQTI